ncbi:hypothetical protein BDD12DRAFT_982275 [Trichophaea hybrida]|nr:hypothetical protein BDD12DRAFT_982275 [Trichophaea hybrida]
MKPFALITLLLALLLANFSAAITLKHSDLIPLDRIDFGAISEIVEAFENATNGEKEAALHKAVKGTILEINFLKETDTYIPGDHEAGAFAETKCTTSQDSPETWKMIWGAFILGARSGDCKMNRYMDCTQFMDYQGAKISLCGKPAKRFGGISRSSGKYVFGYQGLPWLKIPGTVMNHNGLWSFQVPCRAEHHFFECQNRLIIAETLGSSLFVCRESQPPGCISTFLIPSQFKTWVPMGSLLVPIWKAEVTLQFEALSDIESPISHPSTKPKALGIKLKSQNSSLVRARIHLHTPPCCIQATI